MLTPLCTVVFLMSLLFLSVSLGVLFPPSVVQQPAAPALCLLSGEIQPCHRPALLQNQRAPGQRPRADSAGLHGCGRGEALQLPVGWWWWWGGGGFHFYAQPLCNLPGVCPLTAGTALLSLHCVLIERGGHSYFSHFSSQIYAKHRHQRSSCSHSLYMFFFNLYLSRKTCSSK